MDSGPVNGRILVYTDLWDRYRSWCEEHDVAPCGQIVAWVHSDQDLQGYLYSQIILVDAPSAEFLAGVHLRMLEVIDELPKQEVRPGLFIEPVERDSFNLRAYRTWTGLWHARCIGTQQFDWPANPGRLGFTREQAIARATAQARRSDGRRRRGEKIQVPRD